MTSDIDMHYMRMALSYGRRGLGQVAPNPSVGCVIVKGGVVIARGRTAAGGRPHAEAAALSNAGSQAKGATVYVTLEPCAEYGREGPCAEALVKAQVKRVVVACHDLNPAVYKKGIQVLEDAGIEVTFGVLEEEAEAMHRGFFLGVTENRPMATCKLAVSADGKIASAPGERTQISGELAQRHMHLQRSLHDAILVGSETYITDSPELTTRVQGYAHDPLRVVLDRRGRIKDARGFEVVRDDNIESVLTHLKGQGVTRLLVEGGVEIHKSFLDSGKVDEFQLLKSPQKLGENGVNGLDGEQIEAISGLKLQKTRILGEDTLEIYRS